MKKLLTIALAAMLLACVSVSALAEAKITFQMSGEPDSMDPTLNDYSSGSYALQSLFRGLYKYAQDGSLVPAMAESYEVSEDGCTYTFKIREGLKWSDGTPLTAHDFEYSWKRVLDPDVGSETAYTLYAVIKNGYECFVDKTVAVDDLPIKALDDTTLQVELIAPASYFIQLTATTAFMPVQQATVEANGNDWVTTPETYVCNGPFMVAEMKKDESYTFVKNPNYYNADEVQIDTVQYVFLNAAETVKMAFDNGELDIATSVNTDAMVAYQDTENLMASNRIGYRYYEFNCEKEPFNDARVRRALTLALNREILVNAIIQDPTRKTLCGWVPYGIKDVLDPATDWRDVVGDAFAEDIEEAKALLAEAGYPDGEGFPTFSIKYTPSTELENVAQAMSQMWKQYLGLNCEVTAVESGVYWADDTGTRASGDFEIAYMGYTLDYAEPSAAFFILENADGTAKTRWDCPAYLELCSKMRTSLAEEEREALYKEAEALLAEECPVLPVYSYSDAALVASRVKGFTRNSNGHPNFEYCTIAE
ncbi:MAG: peptide ABC transporter substrate-binding protein [Clostridia bacterium]|nr:peptide ABC transporter substrate-binding protein [Clostridia bacterium]